LQTRQIDILGEYENQYVAKDDFSADEFWVTEDVNPNFLNQKVGIKAPLQLLHWSRKPCFQHFL
jgi:hypothetical protein